MADDPLSAALEQVGERAQAATPGPWEAEENEDCWELYGAVRPMLHPLKLIKAPKHGTPYAEYWPLPNDADFIAHARTDVPRLLAAFRVLVVFHAQYMTTEEYAKILAALTGEGAPGG